MSKKSVTFGIALKYIVAGSHVALLLQALSYVL